MLQPKPLLYGLAFFFALGLQATGATRFVHFSVFDFGLLEHAKHLPYGIGTMPKTGGDKSSTKPGLALSRQ